MIERKGYATGTALSHGECQRIVGDRLFKWQQKASDLITDRSPYILIRSVACLRDLGYGFISILTNPASSFRCVRML